MSEFDPLNPRIGIFIDGGHVREELKNAYGDDKFNINMLILYCVNYFFPPDEKKTVQRVYYFDGEVLVKTDPRYIRDKPFLDNIRKEIYVEVITGDLISTSTGWRQKGVDILLSIHMLSKAFLNHYDCAILISGDRDYKELINMIKHYTGKRVYGVSILKDIPQDVKNCYDNFHFIDDPRNNGII